ncbi:MAG: hypothetical protein ACHQ49_16820 [Elusimicrobiota bacterium]
MKITDDLFADFLDCPYKTYLKASGKSGSKSDFEKMQIGLSESYLPNARNHLLRRFGDDGPIGHDLPLGEMIKNRHSLATDIHLAAEGVSVNFDASTFPPRVGSVES